MDTLTVEAYRDAGAPGRRHAAPADALLRALGHVPQTELRPTVSFLELGLDSLFLTQASTAIQKTFGVKVAFRELLEDASTLDAVAATDRFAAATRAPQRPPIRAAAQPLPALPTGLGAVGPAVAGDLIERVVAQQMELMSRQLEMLRAGGASPATGSNAAVAPPAVATPERAPAGPVTASAPTAGKPADGATIAFGPYRPPAKGPTGGLTSEQQQALDAFVERYVQRTAASKQFTAENRAHLADPRSVAGFRLMWKEMVYPIVTSRSAGSKLWDIDGNEYVDLTNGFGMILFGHNPRSSARRSRRSSPGLRDRTRRRPSRRECRG